MSSRRIWSKKARRSGGGKNSIGQNNGSVALCEMLYAFSYYAF